MTLVNHTMPFDVHILLKVTGDRVGLTCTGWPPTSPTSPDRRLQGTRVQRARTFETPASRNVCWPIKSEQEFDVWTCVCDATRLSRVKMNVVLPLPSQSGNRTRTHSTNVHISWQYQRFPSDCVLHASFDSWWKINATSVQRIFKYFAWLFWWQIERYRVYLLSSGLMDKNVFQAWNRSACSQTSHARTKLSEKNNNTVHILLVKYGFYVSESGIEPATLRFWDERDTAAPNGQSICRACDGERTHKLKLMIQFSVPQVPKKNGAKKFIVGMTKPSRRQREITHRTRNVDHRWQIESGRSLWTWCWQIVWVWWQTPVGFTHWFIFVLHEDTTTHTRQSDLPQKNVSSHTWSEVWLEDQSGFFTHRTQCQKFDATPGTDRIDFLDKVNAQQTNVLSTYQNLGVCSDHSRLCQEWSAQEQVIILWTWVCQWVTYSAA